jgi:hypothetical protein
MVPLLRVEAFPLQCRRLDGPVAGKSRCAGGSETEQRPEEGPCVSDFEAVEALPELETGDLPVLSQL